METTKEVNEVFMEINDYKRLSGVRIIVTPKIREVLDKYKIFEKLGIIDYNKSRYRSGKRSLPLKYLFDFPEIFNKIINDNPLFSENSKIKVSLPNKINEDLAYLTGLVCGDGNLLKTNKRDFVVSFHNKEIRLLEEVIKIFEKYFNYETNIKEGHGCKAVIVRSKVIFSFFNKIMEIEHGRKQNIKISYKIKTNRKLIRSFIAGFFDAEGTVDLKKNKITCQISFAQKQKEILEEIRRELIKDSIETKFCADRNYWKLYGNKSSLKPFLEKIPIMHPMKKQKLETAVKNQLS